MLTDFLKQIVPDNSIVCLSRSRSQANASIGRPALHFNNLLFTPAEMEHAEAVVTSWTSKPDTEVYFGVAGYASKVSRKKANVAAIKALFLDVDLWSEKLAAQPGKKKEDFYATKAEALRGVKELCTKVPVLPRPLVVDSGRGLHVYFLLEQALPPARWEPLAEAFRDTVRKHVPRLAADPVRMCDSASVLRLPGSTNNKDPDNSLPVKVLINGAIPQDYDLLMAALGGAETVGLPLPPAWAQGENHFQVGHEYQREFKDIEPRPVLTGCLQMKHHLTTKGAVTEPEWLLACRVFTCLRNGTDIAHRFSNPAFKRTIDRKLKHAATNFDAPSAACKEWPDQSRCDGCEHRGVVLFPVEIAAAATAKREADEAVSKAVAEAAQVAVQATNVPALPTGYLPLAAGYAQGTSVSGYPFTEVIGVNKDSPNSGANLIAGHMNVKYTTAEVTSAGRHKMRVHLDVASHQGRSSVAIPVGDLTSSQLDTATKAMRDCGMTFDSDSIAKAKALKRMFAHVTQVAGARMVPWFPHKGWDADCPRGSMPLVVGARRYQPDGSIEQGVTQREHIGKDMVQDNVIESFCNGVPRGSLAAWQHGMSVYNRPDMELAQMLMLSGLGNLLLPLISQAPGGIMLALSGKAGIGKTTLLRFLASMIGDPASSMIPGSSTPNALVNMLSQAGFLLLAVDDTLKMDATQLSLYLNSVSGGSEKLRMTDSSDGWSTQSSRPFYSSMIVTTNFDVGSVIGSGRATDAQMNNDAARSRLLEVPAQRIRVPHDVSPGDWRRHEVQVLENHGHALEVFARYVVPRQRVITDELREVEAQIHADLRDKAPIAARGALRFWSKYLACVYVAGRVVTLHSPILPWDVDAILRAGKRLVVDTDIEAAEDKADIVEAMWDAFTDTQNDRISINYTYMKQNGRGPVHWDENVVGQQLIQGRTMPGNSVTTLGQKYRWRVIITRVTNADGTTLHYARRVAIRLNHLEALISYAAGRTLKAADWSEVYDAFRLKGEVRGVKDGQPKRVIAAGPGMCRTPIDALPTRQGCRRACIEMEFPPLDPSEVEPA